MMMRTIIVDDEEQSRKALRITLEQWPQKLTVIAEADSTAVAVSQINRWQPELVFLDIQLGDGSGFDVIEQCEWKDFQVIFVTAYNQYALQAFKVHAQAYLLKPIDEAQVKVAIDRLQQPAAYTAAPPWQAVLRYVRNSYEKISFTTTEGVHLYTPDEIVHCEADNNYSRIYLTSGEQLYIAKTLKELELQLLPVGFERIHKSHLINMHHLRKYLNRDGGTVLMEGGTWLPVSQRKKTYMLQLLNRFGL